MTPHDSSKKKHSFVEFFSLILWILFCLFALGFPAKYKERLRLFEDLVCLKHEPWSLEASFSDRGDPFARANNPGSLLKTMRQKQQEEWDRLNIAMSVITATSAAALAIEATNGRTHIYWLVTVFYSIAFGLSLEGVILITYMTIAAGGSSDEGITRLARGILVSEKHPAVRPTAFIMALPAIMTTYSSFSLLLGLVTMVVSGPGEGVDTMSVMYSRATMIPVGLGFFFLCIAIVLCEIGYWIETLGRKKYRNNLPKGTDGRVEPGVQMAAHSKDCCPDRIAAESARLVNRAGVSSSRRSGYSSPTTVTR